MSQGDLFGYEPPREPDPFDVFSDCGMYRYVVGYPTGAPGSRRLCAVLHNPSTASAADTDPTAETVIRLGRREGCAWSIIVNPFAFKATDKTDLLKAADPCGPKNLAHVHEQCNAADLIVVGWGIVAPSLQARLREFRSWLTTEFSPLLCVGINKDGSPRHPLYVRGDAPFLPWPTPRTP